MRGITTGLICVGSIVAVMAGFDGPERMVVTGQASAAMTPVVAVPDAAAERLAGAVRIRTISTDDPTALDAAAFGDLHAYLAQAFPRVHALLRRETVSMHSLLYTWPGRDPSLKPILLIGHMDVVPVEEGTGQEWRYGPFGGHIADGFVWGRGSIDNKLTVLGTLEAVEMLLVEGFQPTRTVHLAFGHDEETGGANGAREIATLLERRGVKLEMVLDEGGVIADGVLPGMPGPVALVGVAEKGFVSVELDVRGAGGHSSLPPPQSAAGILSAAVARLERNQMPARLEGPTRALVDAIRPRSPIVQRTLFANLWLTRGLVSRRLEASPATNAMVRTTTAVTMLQAGTKDNVLPAQARAIVNFRILPGDTVASVVEHVRGAVRDDRVHVKIVGRFTAEPSAASPTGSAPFQALSRSILSTTPDAIVAPYLVVVATDARHYGHLTRNVFRFLPLRLSARDVERVHGIDERVGVQEYQTAIRTYRQLVIEVAGRGSSARAT